jgi:hypothetical protein
MVTVREHFLSISITIGLTLIIAILTFAGLSGLSRSEGLAVQFATAKDELKILHHSEKTSPGGAIFPKGTVCRGDPATAADALRARITAAVATDGASLRNIFAAPEQPKPNAPDFTPVVFSFEARGGHEAIVRLLGDLAKATPVIFAERAEVTTQVTELTLKLKGEVLCSSHASS